MRLCRDCLWSILAYLSPRGELWLPNSECMLVPPKLLGVQKWNGGTPEEGDAVNDCIGPVSRGRCAPFPVSMPPLPKEQCPDFKYHEAESVPGSCLIPVLLEGVWRFCCSMLGICTGVRLSNARWSFEIWPSLSFRAKSLLRSSVSCLCYLPCCIVNLWCNSSCSP